MRTSCGITVSNTRQMNLRKIQYEAARIVSGATIVRIVSEKIDILNGIQIPICLKTFF